MKEELSKLADEIEARGFKLFYARNGYKITGNDLDISFPNIKMGYAFLKVFDDSVKFNNQNNNNKSVDNNLNDKLVLTFTFPNESKYEEEIKAELNGDSIWFDSSLSEIYHGNKLKHVNDFNSGEPDIELSKNGVSVPVHFDLDLSRFCITKRSLDKLNGINSPKVG